MTIFKTAPMIFETLNSKQKRKKKEAGRGRGRGLCFAGGGGVHAVEPSYGRGVLFYLYY